MERLALRAKLAAVALGIAAACATGRSSAAEIGMQDRIAVLTAPEMQGRGAGTAGIDAAAERIASWFEVAGLKPGGEDGSWYQTFMPESPRIADAAVLPPGAEWGKIRLRNVVGILPGTGEGWVVVGAHYDHLGFDGEGRIFAGADDNASGVAALCEAAAELAKESPRARGILFIAFSGEEWGLLGSSWYVAHPLRPLASVTAMINLDTVGRMEGRKLFAFSAASGAELADALRGVNLGFGFDLAIPEKGPFGSDQISFIEKGIPAIHLFTGPNADYHRITDTAEKINIGDLQEVAAFTAELARFLAGRDRRITFTTATAPAAPATPPQMVTTRRVSLGTVPDFAWQGEGVRVDGVLPGSPAETAGIRKGDVLVGFDGEKVASLEDYTAALKARNPGDRVKLTLSREGETLEVEAVLAERK